MTYKEESYVLDSIKQIAKETHENNIMLQHICSYIDNVLINRKNDEQGGGGSWRMPTTEEFVKLRDAVTTEFVTDYKNSGVNGLLCTANDGSNKTLFFPACGYAGGGSMSRVGSYGSYWSSPLDSSNVNNAYDLNFVDGRVLWQFGDLRCYGFAVRGVLAEN